MPREGANYVKITKVKSRLKNFLTRSEVRERIVLRLSEGILAPAFLSPAGQSVWRTKFQLRNIRPRKRYRCAIVAHIYYPELLEEIITCWRATPEGTHLHITTIAEHKDELARRLNGEKAVLIHIYENRGRDIAPFLEVFNSGALTNYDAVLKLHTKRSPHLRTGGRNRRLLFANLAGNSLQVNRILEIFDTASIGLVGWSRSYRNGEAYWMANKARVIHLCHRIEPHAIVRSSFFEGSMFWFRPAALAPLRKLALTQKDFEEEAGQTDGALHHAVERVFNLAVVAAGYKVLSENGTVLLQSSAKKNSLAVQASSDELARN